MNGAAGGYSGPGYRGASGAPPRNFEERAQAKEQMMISVRESSQQDRRVYVGNLSYDVKWHHLKDFMRQGKLPSECSEPRIQPLMNPVYSRRGSLRRCPLAPEWHVEGGLKLAGFLVYLVIGIWIDGLGLCPWVM